MRVLYFCVVLSIAGCSNPPSTDNSEERSARSKYKEYWTAIHESDKNDGHDQKKADDALTKAVGIWEENKTLFRTYGMKHVREVRTTPAR